MQKDAKLLSLEQCREKQLLTLMYELSKRGLVPKITARATKQQDKYVYKTDTKIGKKYEKSELYFRETFNSPRTYLFSKKTFLQYTKPIKTRNKHNGYY